MGSLFSFFQLVFLTLCILFSVAFTTHYFEGGWHWINVAVGLLGGCALSAAFWGIGAIFKRFHLRSFNTAALGLLFGYFMGQAIIFTLSGAMSWDLSHPDFLPIRFLIFMGCAYLGMNMTLRAGEEIRVSLPFIEFKQMSYKKKDILVDISILSDSRFIDLATTGLLDHHLIIPRFAVKELYAQTESLDEMTKAKARRSLEMIKKLESLPSLDLRYVDNDFPELKEPMSKLIRLARMMDTHIITSDINRIQQSSIEGVRIINIHMLSNALKPVTQAGESISIKIQRYGKEARQGVGYLEDGTMVVVNGGAEFIGESIKAHVLSVKHTSSGRMIFCNAAEEGALLMNTDFPEELLQSDAVKSSLAL